MKNQFSHSTVPNSNEYDQILTISSDPAFKFGQADQSKVLSKRKRGFEGMRQAETSKYLCPVEGCGKMYSTSSNLSVHVKKHVSSAKFNHLQTGMRPYRCSVCFKGFLTKSHLQNHEKTHTGEKPFKCPYSGCNKAYGRSCRLKVHIRNHVSCWQVLISNRLERLLTNVTF